MKNKIKIIIFLQLLILFVGCKKDDIHFYIGDNGVSFSIKNLNYSLFGKTSKELEKDTIDLEIRLVGRTVDYDRFVEADIVEDSADTEEKDKKHTVVKEQFNLLGGKIEAGKNSGYFKVEIINLDKYGDLDNKLHIKLNKLGDFGAGLSENENMEIVWSRKLLKPITWKYSMRFFFCSEYSTEVYKRIIEVTGMTEMYYKAMYPNHPDAIPEKTMAFYGSKFGELIREYEKRGEPLYHDDGDSKGQKIIPLY